MIKEILAAAKSAMRLGRRPKNPGRSSQLPFMDPYLANTKKRAKKANASTLRALAKEPNIRKAMNSIILPLLQMEWTVVPAEGYSLEDKAVAARCEQAIKSLQRPNGGETFRVWAQRLLEDGLNIGVFTAEQKPSGDAERPFRSWTMDAAKIEVDLRWNGEPYSTRFIQKNGPFLKEIPFDDVNVMFGTPDPNTYSIFGTGPVEYVFNTINDYLTAYDQAAAVAGDGMPGFLIDMGEGSTQEDVENLRSYFKAYIEGKGRIPIVGGKKSMQVMRFFKGDSSDQRIEWLEFLLKIIANGFGISPRKLGLVKDVNRSTAEQGAEDDDITAIKPWAQLLAEHINVDLFQKLMGWEDITFKWLDLEKEDQERESRIHKTYLDADVYTPNEVRACLGEDPLPGEIGNLTKTERMIALAQARGTAVYTSIPGLTPEEQARMREENMEDEIENSDADDMLEEIDEASKPQPKPRPPVKPGVPATQKKTPPTNGGKA